MQFFFIVISFIILTSLALKIFHCQKTKKVQVFIFILGIFYQDRVIFGSISDQNSMIMIDRSFIFLHLEGGF